MYVRSIVMDKSTLTSGLAGGSGPSMSGSSVLAIGSDPVGSLPVDERPEPKYVQYIGKLQTGGSDC